MGDLEVTRVGQHRRVDLFFGAEGHVNQRQQGADINAEGSGVVPLVGAKVEV